MTFFKRLLLSFSKLAKTVVRVMDLIKLPKKDFSKEVQQKKRRAPATAPDYHLTGEKSMKFIAETDERKKEKIANDTKLNKIKVEAVKAAKAKDKVAKKGPVGKSCSKKPIKSNPRL